MTRIIAGEWRGHSLPTLKGGSVRPTTDRARTVLFDTLRYVHDLNVLDLFSGTGALGFEAMSRGAKSLVSVDRDRNYIKQQTAWIDTHPMIFKAYIGEVGNILKRLKDSFDLIFADPPYAEEIPAHVLRLIEEHAGPDARFVYEKSRKNTGLIESDIFKLEKEKVVAETRIQIYKVLEL